MDTEALHESLYCYIELYGEVSNNLSLWDLKIYAARLWSNFAIHSLCHILHDRSPSHYRNHKCKE
jgi:hypothetical protein